MTTQTMPEYRVFSFAGVSVPTMRHNGVVWVALPSLMDALALNKRAQNNRISLVAGQFGIMSFRLPIGGKKTMVRCIRVGRINEWLDSINENGIDMIARELVREFRDNFTNIIAMAWAETDQQTEKLTAETTAPHIESTAVQIFEFDNVKTRTFEFEGEPWVAMKPIVEGIGMAWKPQYLKLLEQKDKFGCYHMVTTNRAGLLQEMVCIPVRKFPLWLVSVNPEKVDAAIKPRLEMWQEMSGNALHDFWTRGVAVHPAIAESMPAWVKSPEFAGMIAGIVAAVIGSEEVRGMIGGIVKANISKQLQPLLGRASDSATHMTSLQIAEKYKVPSKGRRPFNKALFWSLQRFYDANQKPYYQSAGPQPRYHWHVDGVAAWHKTVGKKLIDSHMATLSTPLFEGKLRVHQGGKK